MFACSRKISAHSDWQAIINLYNTYTNIQIYKYTNMQICKYTNIQTYKHTNIQIYKYTKYKYTNIYVCMGTTAISEVGTGHSTENSDKSLY